MCSAARVPPGTLREAGGSVALAACAGTGATALDPLPFAVAP